MIIAAAAADVVDYSKYTPTRHWFTHESLLLAAFERQQLAKVWEAKLAFRTSGAFESQQTLDDAREAVKHVTQALVPWLVNGDDLATEGNRIDHMIADWYRYFAGDKLPEMLKAYRDE